MVGRIGVGVSADSTQPVLIVSHTAQQAEGSVVSLRNESGQLLLENTSLQAYSESAFSSPELQVGGTYGIYIDGEKKTDVTLNAITTRISDDGGEFTGGSPWGRW